MTSTRNRPLGGRWPALALLLALASPTVFAETYFIRADGGSADQCTGLSDSPYPGSGTGQDCAWNHPFVALPPAQSPRIQGGDTLLIGEGDYRMGYGAPETGSCGPSWSWDCTMPAVPSGPSVDEPTRILGVGHEQSCQAAPELWGSERANHVLNLEGSSNVEVACLEITDRASCIEFHCHNGQCDGEIAACDRDSAPWGDWASIGIKASDSSNVILRDVNIHGLAVNGVSAGRLSDWTMESVKINGNGWAGWDGDIGPDSSSSGTMLFVDSEIAWNGCVEDWQTGEHFGCWGQGGGGYGDGLGVGESRGHWIFEDSRVHHNTSDGIDLLYLRDDGAATVRRTLVEANAGNQVKVSRNAVVENSVIVGNCSYFADEPNMHGGDICRALGDTVSVGFDNGSNTDLINNTIVGQGNCVISGHGGNSDSVLQIANNLIMGNDYWHNPSQTSCLYYSGSSEQVIWDNNFINDVRHDACPGDSQCDGQPGIEGPSLGDFDADPVSGSPLITAADDGLAPENDFYGMPRGVGGAPDIGAIEFGAEEAPDLAAVFTYDCSDRQCQFDASGSEGAIDTWTWQFGDGNKGSGETAGHEYADFGQYTVTLTISGAGGGNDVVNRQVTLEAPEPLEPAFIEDCQELTCQFDASGSGGPIADHEWTFGDGNSASGSVVNHAFDGAGTYLVGLTVIAEDGRSESIAKSVTVEENGDVDPDIWFMARGVDRINGPRFVRMRWRGVSTDATDIYLNGEKIAATLSYQLYADRLDSSDPDELTYRICNHNTQVCSNTVTVEF